jgi:aconitase B
VTYKRRPVLVAMDEDRPMLPMEFQDALKAKGRLRWKAAQEYSQADLQMEEGTYEAMIARKMASYLMTPGKRLGMRNQVKSSVRSPFRRF